MSELFQALSSPYASFLRYAFIVGIISGIPFGIIGTYVVTKRISYIAGAISHSVLGGIGAALYFNFNPTIGAIAAALIAAFIIGFVSLYAKQREDSVIGSVWAIGMALGIIFIAKTPAFTSSLMSYLFGNILLITRTDLIVVSILSLIVLAICCCFYNKFLAVCFDEEHARSRGINVSFYYLLLLCLTAVTIVLLVRIVGIIMVIALLTLPPAVASYFSKKLSVMMILSTVLCIFFTTIGTGTSFIYNLPSGPTIIIFAGLVYIAVTAFSMNRNS
jgi:zinc transport system permease protein